MNSHSNATCIAPGLPHCQTNGHHPVRVLIMMMQLRENTISNKAGMENKRIAKSR